VYKGEGGQWLSDQKHILLATLGGQPQIVTFTLDLLLPTYPISEVVVVHPSTSDERLRHAVLKLQTEFSAPYVGQMITFRSHTLRYQDRPIDDISDSGQADGVLDTMHRLVVDLKQQSYCIHLLVAGGRRLMSLLSVPVATLNFDHHDRIWHLFTPQVIQEQAEAGRLMHVPAGAGTRLIQAPFIPLGAYIANSSTNFRAAQAEQQAHMNQQEYERCKQAIEQLTPRERDVVHAFTQENSQQEVASALGISMKTVDHHKTRIFEVCREVWNFEPDYKLSSLFLCKTFLPYFGRTEHTPSA
jgi:CRISPR-associated protein Csx14